MHMGDDDGGRAHLKLRLKRRVAIFTDLSAGVTLHASNTNTAKKTIKTQKQQQKSGFNLGHTPQVVKLRFFFLLAQGIPHEVKARCLQADDLRKGRRRRGT